MALSLRHSVDEIEEVSEPQLQTIPLPEYDFGEKGLDLYWKHCQMLRERGLLTEMNREIVNSLALAAKDLDRCIAKGASTRYSRSDRDSALRKLSKLYGDGPVSQTAEGANPYAAFGFAKRARQRRHRQD